MMTYYARVSLLLLQSQLDISVASFVVYFFWGLYSERGGRRQTSERRGLICCQTELFRLAELGGPFEIDFVRKLSVRFAVFVSISIQYIFERERKQDEEEEEKVLVAFR